MYIETDRKPGGETQTFAEVMEKAAKILEERGKAVNHLVDGEKVCTYAAISMAQNMAIGSIDISAAHNQLSQWLRLSKSDICDYNNSHTTEEVTAMLRRAAVEA